MADNRILPEPAERLTMPTASGAGCARIQNKPDYITKRTRR